ncbi:uncharacterized protein RAG0_06225 [Rhynchosporium agropyri]|uniref:Uncharacterized protein n=3 Tax=Rhynchosporium TaxID=38037 RepID=A0A1E1MPW2_RHYSE|nr:uncharacterized protein RAG0_06225 [Rhynchosporium agropyri]CZT12895.1 uncharacterized protein RCO7_15202 [Rhynchosporium commune]CZT51137.1 uncharacterized protein RSE6_12236 [Rhynchosporium secalis]
MSCAIDFSDLWLCASRIRRHDPRAVGEHIANTSPCATSKFISSVYSSNGFCSLKEDCRDMSRRRAVPGNVVLDPIFSRLVGSVVDRSSSGVQAPLSAAYAND